MLFRSGVSLHEKIIFIRNLAAMLDAGLPLTRAMDVLERQAPNKALKKIVGGLIEEVSHGSTF